MLSVGRRRWKSQKITIELPRKKALGIMFFFFFFLFAQEYTFFDVIRDDFFFINIRVQFINTKLEND